jgi:hypothetical protein
MGYMIKVGDGAGHRSVSFTDGVWMDVIQTASKHGYSAPGVRLERGGKNDLPKEAAEGLASALDRALEVKGIEPDTGEGGALDRDLARRIIYVLRGADTEDRDVQLSRTHRWKDGDD